MHTFTEMGLSTDKTDEWRQERQPSKGTARKIKKEKNIDREHLAFKGGGAGALRAKRQEAPVDKARNWRE